MRKDRGSFSFPGWALCGLVISQAFAGTAWAAGTDARFNGPTGLAVDAAGNVYVGDQENDTIRKLTRVGAAWSVTTLAGEHEQQGSVDGTGAAARFYFPTCFAVGPSVLYVSDEASNLIRAVTPAGHVATLAGTPNQLGYLDGPGSAALFGNPLGLALDGSGNLYVADSLNFVIRKITPAGVVSTFAGKAGEGGTVDGTGAAARFSFPAGLAADGTGNLYVVDYSDSVIRKITPAGVVTTVAGAPGQSGSVDGPGTTARFMGPMSVALDGAGNLYVTEFDNNTIRRLTPSGAGWVVSTLAGAPGQMGDTDGMGAAARFNNPFGVAVDASGNVFVSDYSNDTIRMITPAGRVSTVAGAAGQAGWADAVTTAVLAAPALSLWHVGIAAAIGILFLAFAQRRRARSPRGA